MVCLSVTLFCSISTVMKYFQVLKYFQSWLMKYFFSSDCRKMDVFQIVEKWMWPFTLRCDQLNINHFSTIWNVEKWMWPFTMRCDQLNINHFSTIWNIFLWVSQHLSLDKLRFNLSALRSFKLNLVYYLVYWVFLNLYATLNLSDFIV